MCLESLRFLVFEILISNPLFNLPSIRPKDAEGDSNFDEAKVEELFREKFSDLTIDKEEGLELVEFFKEHTPPKSKLGWTRACAFRIGSELLSDDKSKNISLLRCINYVIHALETNCLT